MGEVDADSYMDDGNHDEVTAGSQRWPHAGSPCCQPLQPLEQDVDEGALWEETEIHMKGRRLSHSTCY